MRVYHGSYTRIHEIDLSKCEIGKDFGQGFYVTDETSEFYKKTWQEIYELLKQELK